MYCRMIRGIYLRANGELACYCGPGEEINLGNVPVDHIEFDFIKDFYLNRGHENVRKCMSRDILPYPGVCLKCIYLDPEGSHNAELASKEIEWMHIESSSNCNLDCRFCIPMSERSSYRDGTTYLPEKVYKKIVRDIAANGMTVKWSYSRGRGEAGLHKGIWEMVKFAKENIETNFMVNTAGNIPYSDEIVDSGLDKIKIAIDGPDQKTYETYRRGGKLERVLRLTKGITDRKRVLGVKHPKVVWQYILFEHNDGDEQLKKIQKMAVDHDVDQILFKTTFTSGFSEKSLDSIPVVHSDISRLDIKAMVDTSSEELTRRCSGLKKLESEERWEECVRRGINISKDIFRWFILGIEKKQEYNRYGDSDEVSLMLEMAKNGGRKAEEILENLKVSLSVVSKGYQKTGRSENALYYHSFLEKLAPNNRELPDKK